MNVCVLQLKTFFYEKKRNTIFFSYYDEINGVKENAHKKICAEQHAYFFKNPF